MKPVTNYLLRLVNIVTVVVILTLPLNGSGQFAPSLVTPRLRVGVMDPRGSALSCKRHRWAGGSHGLRADTD